MPALAIREDVPATKLRRLARFEPDRRAAMRLSANADALEGRSRAEAAWLAAGRDGAAGAQGRHIALQRGRVGRAARPAPFGTAGSAYARAEQAALKAGVLRGPNPERDGVSAWRLADICAHAEDAYGVRYSKWGMSRRLRRLGLSRRKARPRHPRGSEAERAAFKNGLGSKLEEIAAAHPGARIQLWCEDEARTGQKGRVCHPCYQHGIRPPGPADQRFDSLLPFAACRPGTDEAFALAFAEATTVSMSLFLTQFAQVLDPGAHGALILDRAGWHLAHGLVVPDKITLVRLPPYSPELNPVERVWLYLRERPVTIPPSWPGPST